MTLRATRQTAGSGRRPAASHPAGVALPVIADVARLHEVRPGDRDPSPLSRKLRGARAGTEKRDRDRRVRALVRLREGTDPELGARTVLDPDVPILPFVHVRGIFGPEGEDRVDGLAHHRAPVGIPVDLEELEVRGEAPGADAHLEAPPGEMVEHRGLARDDGGMLERQAEHPGAELDVPGTLDEGGEKHEGRGDGLGEGAHVLADPALEEAEPIREDDGLAILLQHLRVVAPDIVDGLHEHAKLHGMAAPLLSLYRGRRALWHTAGSAR